MLELNDVLNTNKGIAAHCFSTVGKKLAEKFRGVKPKIENPYEDHMEIGFLFTNVT